MTWQDDADSELEAIDDLSILKMTLDGPLQHEVVLLFLPSFRGRVDHLEQLRRRLLVYLQDKEADAVTERVITW